jgi:hypothetical protein
MPIGKQLSDGNPDGTSFGQSATDKISFYGLATPIVQPSGAAQAAVVDSSGGTANPATGMAALTGTYNSAIIANALATLAAQGNAVRGALVALNIIKGEA